MQKENSEIDKKIDKSIYGKILDSAKYRKIFERAIRSFHATYDAHAEEREQCVRDRRFCWVRGAQWEGFLDAQWENRPRIEVNKAQMSVTRINNEYKSNRISATFVPADGSDDDETIDDLNSLYRADRQANGTGYVDNSFIDAISGGIGGWRLRTEYKDESDPDSDEKVIRFEYIPDADKRLFFNLGAVRQDKSDATEGWILTALPKIEYQDRYNDVPDSWPVNDYATVFDWCSHDVVYIAEYYQVEQVKEVVHIFGGLAGDEKTISHDEYLEQDEMDELAAMGYRELRNKKITRRKVHKYIMSGGGILEDCGYIAGEYIPAVIVYGKRIFIDNIERVSGHIRTCIDPQRIANVQKSKLLEIAAYSSIEKPIFTTEQVQGREQRWADDLIQNYPYLLVNQVYDQNGTPIQAGPVGYTKSPQLPPALAALIQITDGDLNDLTGNQQQGETLQSNTSGLAVELIQAQISMQTSGYMDNLAMAEAHSARVWVSQAKDIYVEEGREIKGMTESGTPEKIALNVPVMTDKGVERKNDFSSLGKMDVIVEVGPSSESRRAATEKGLINLMGAVKDPETLTVLGNMILANSSGEGMAEIRPYFRNNLIKIGALKPTDEEIEQLQSEKQEPPPPTPEQQANVEFLTASAEAEKAKADNLRAQTVKVQAEARQVLASTQKALADAHLAEAKAVEVEKSIQVIP
jgi:hypothetical protein